MATLRRWKREPFAFVQEALRHPDGTPLGERMDDWQRKDFEQALASRRNVWWERPRGHSKTADAAAIALCELVTGAPGQRIYCAACDQQQAGLVHDTVRGFINRNPLLAEAIKVTRWECILTEADSCLTVLAADAPGSWGLRPNLLVLEELHAWRGDRAEEYFQSLISALGKVKGARALASTTAGWDRTSLAWRLREQVQNDPGWIFSRRGQCASWITLGFLEQQKRILPAHVYAMLHDNEWTDAGGEFLTWPEVTAVFPEGMEEQRASETDGIYWAGLDIGTAKDRTSLAIVQAKGETVQVATARLWQGTPQDRVQLAEVEEAAAGLAQQYHVTELVMDPFQGLLLAERLRARGIRVREYAFTSASRAALFESLLQLIRQQRLKSYAHQELKDELAGLRWTVKNGVLRPDHSVSGHDDVAVSVALAAMAAATRPAPLDYSTMTMDMRFGWRESPWAAANGSRRDW